MPHVPPWRDRYASFRDRIAAKRAGRAKTTTQFTMQPEPRNIGLVAKGRQLVAGDILVAGQRAKQPQRSIWDIAIDQPAATADLHGCDWLDDLAALGDPPARATAQAWVFDWITRYGAGTGPGWQAAVTAQRLTNWINHSDFLLRGQNKRKAATFYQSLARQSLFLASRCQSTPPGLPRITALAGAIHAGLMLEGQSAHVDRAVVAFTKTCLDHTATDGTVRSRNPEELLNVLSYMTTVAQVLQSAGRPVPAAISDMITRIVPTLRALRHADSSLARFHGGGPGAEGMLESTLALTGVKTPATPGLAMGYARLIGGRTTLIVDAAAPPMGAASRDAHASTLGIELTSGRRPLIVNCGSGAQFGDDWRRASRATPSHATLGLDGISSSHLGAVETDWLTQVPSTVRAEMGTDSSGQKLNLSHNGYQPSHGLTHARLLHLSRDGRRLTGEDLLTTLDKGDEQTFDHVFDQTLRAGVSFAIRFHLHPDVTLAVTRDNGAVTLWLKSGEIWVFQHDGAAQLTISPSVYLENGQLKPRATQQVVLSGNALAYATRIRWSLAKAENTPLAVRDLAGAFPLDVADQT